MIWTATALRNAAAPALPAPRSVGVRTIQAAVAAQFGVRVHDLTGISRLRCLVRPRQIAMSLSREMTVRSLPEIGRLFCRDHSTVCHAIRQVDSLAQADPDFADVVMRCRQAARRGRVA